jgi:hypothetical protein
MSGCGTVSSFGRRGDSAALESSLKMRASTKADVPALLGEPRNAGGAMLPGHDTPRELWCYDYEESTTVEAHRLLLFVFFDGDLYDRYMWFSSLP